MAKTPEIIFYPWKMSIICNGTWQALSFLDIVYLKSSGNHTEIATHKSNRRYYVLCSLDKFEETLPYGFFRCHRSAIVNMRYIQKIGKENVLLNNGIDLPISLSRIPLLEAKLAELPSLTMPICDHCEECPKNRVCKYIRPFVAFMDG